MGLLTDQLRAERVEANMPKLTHLSPSDNTLRILGGWGLKNPYLGQVVHKDQNRTWFAWSGLPSRHHEIPVLIARTEAKKPLYKAAWNYGVLDVETYIQAEQKGEALLDAAVHNTTRSYTTEPNLDQIVEALNQLVPSGYATAE